MNRETDDPGNDDMSQYDNDTTVGATTWAGGQVPVSLYERARQTMIDQGLAWDSTLTEALNLWLEKKAASGAEHPPSSNDIPASVSSTLAARQSVESLLESSFPPEFFRRVKALVGEHANPHKFEQPEVTRWLPRTA